LPTILFRTQTMAMIKRKHILLVLFCVICFGKIHAQNADFRSRLAVEVSGDINDRFGASVEIQERQKNNLVTFDKLFIEPALSFKLNKAWRTGVELRLMADSKKSRSIAYKMRPSVYVRYKFDVDDFDIRLKTSLQYGFDELTNLYLSYNQKLINRNSITIGYNWYGTKLKPEVGAEFYYHINSAQGGVINQVRLKAGVNYKINKRSSIDLYYLFDNEMNVSYPVDSHVLGITYALKFN
jgi:long-subunit fatty acid transport protein